MQRNVLINRLNKAIAENPRITLESLELAVEFSWQKRMPIQSPMSLCSRVDDALAWASVPEVKTPMETRRFAALQNEMGSGLPDSDTWVQKLQRAYGDGLEIVLEEWENARRVAFNLTPDRG
jgi:hypothetical protein